RGVAADWVGAPVAATAGRWTSTTATQLRAARKSTRSTGMPVQRRSVPRRALREDTARRDRSAKARDRAWATRKTVRTRASSRCTIVGTTSSIEVIAPESRGVYLIPRTVAKWKLSHARVFAWAPSPGQAQERLQQRVGAPSDRLPVAHLVGPVAAPAAGGNEQHPGGGDRGQVLGVVARAGGHAPVAEAQRVARGLHRIHDAGR